MPSPMRPRPPCRASGSTGPAPRSPTCSSTPVWPARRVTPRRTLEQGGAYVNDRKADGVDRTIGPSDLLADRYVVLRRGKRDYHLVSFDLRSPSAG